MIPPTSKFNQVRQNNDNAYIAANFHTVFMSCPRIKSLISHIQANLPCGTHKFNPDKCTLRKADTPEDETLGESWQVSMHCS